jgi:hypothetical protein
MLPPSLEPILAPGYDIVSAAWPATGPAAAGGPDVLNLAEVPDRMMADPPAPDSAGIVWTTWGDEG